MAKFIYYPFIVVLIMAGARLRYFDKWDMPVGLFIVIMLALLFSIYCAISLLHSAQKAKEQILERLRKKQMEAKDKKNKELFEQIQMMYDDVKSISKGGFCSFF